MVRIADRLDMTIAVEWDIKPQTKQMHYCRCFNFIGKNDFQISWKITQ